VRPLSTHFRTAVHYVVRCQSRLPAFGKVHLKRDGVPDVVLTLRNVSKSGFMALTDEHIPAGSQVRLAIPYVGIVTADVRWSHNNRMGCQMVRDFSAGQLARLFIFCTPRSLPAEVKILTVTLTAMAAIAFA